MIRNLSATFLFLALHLTSSAQDLDYFAELNAPLSFGDSRFTALAGNMVGMSGSLTALALNPATVGLYRQDAFSASGNIFNSRNRSTNGGTIGNSSNLNVGNVGFVARDPNNGWHVFFSYNTDQLYRGRRHIQCAHKAHRHEKHEKLLHASKLTHLQSGLPCYFWHESCDSTPTRP